MTRKLFLRLDQGTLPPQDYTAIAGASSVTSIDTSDHYYQYALETITLDHALLLFGTNKSRFGFDLFHYLHSAQGFFGQTDEGMIVMPDSTPDFKRRYSEDLGVALGILLAADTLTLQIESVTQIPTNQRLDKYAKTPDFIGFDGNNRKRVIECKGTTLPQDIDKHRQNAKNQLASHQENGVPKFAMVTYIPSSTKLIPAFMFVSDPPIPLPAISRVLAIGLHYVTVFEFAGIPQLADSLRQVLIEQLRYDQTIAGGKRSTYFTRLELSNAMDSFGQAVSRFLEHRFKVDLGGAEFIGTWRTTLDHNRTVWAFTGVSTQQLYKLQTALKNSIEPNNVFELPSFRIDQAALRAEQQYLSLFSDGTILFVTSIEPDKSQQL
ncbi:MAG TPA: hypothetical protein VJR02_09205 [Pyrinomonadaceae bacterium]|nr:hypothetical protein [Pyrinomonadaceae bacterium]